MLRMKHFRAEMKTENDEIFETKYNGIFVQFLGVLVSSCSY